MVKIWTQMQGNQYKRKGNQCKKKLNLNNIAGHCSGLPRGGLSYHVSTKCEYREQNYVYTTVL